MKKMLILLATLLGAMALAVPASAEGLSTGHHGTGFVAACAPAESGPHSYTIAAADASIKAIGADSWEVVSSDGTSRRVEAMNGIAQVTLDSPPTSVHGVRLQATVDNGTPVAMMLTDQPDCREVPAGDRDRDPVAAPVTKTPPRVVQPVAVDAAIPPVAATASAAAPNVLAHTGTSVLLLLAGAIGLVLLGLGVRSMADHR